MKKSLILIMAILTSPCYATEELPATNAPECTVVTTKKGQTITCTKVLSSGTPVTVICSVNNDGTASCVHQF